MNHKAWLYPAAGVVALAGLFFLFKPRDEPRAESPPAALEPATTDVTQAQIVDWVVEQGQRVSGPAVLKLREGDRILLRVRSDHDDELHVHGYDLHLELKAGAPAELAFTVDRSGRFEIELHRAHLELGALEVQPQ